MKTPVEIEIDPAVYLPCYQHLLHEPDHAPPPDIDFLYGGRDSGKSRFVAQRLVHDCLSQPYFKCILTRKVKDTIKESQWDLIRSVVDDWGLSHFFTFNVSPLEIRCINGNRFITRGLDEPTKLKSVNNPSHCWVEEGNQIEAEDFAIILTSLRCNQGNVKTWFTFNPECPGNYTDFWLWQEYFSHTTDLSFTHHKIIHIDNEKFSYRIRATHTTYRNTYTLGLWGYRRTGGNYWKCFDEARHVADLQLQPGTIHVVLDNNVNPYVSVQLWQIDEASKTLNQVHEIPCAHPHNTASKAAKAVSKWLSLIGYTDVVYIYGDPSANAKSTVDDEGRSFFDKFNGQLLSEQWPVRNRVQSAAPGVAISGEFINEIYESGFAGWSIRINTTCRKSIEDYLMAKEDAEGRILKQRITDKQTGLSYEPYGHLSDCKRYFITTVLAPEFEHYRHRRKRVPTVGGIHQVRRGGKVTL